ncbi:glycosyltransferase [Mesorhizobium sp. BR1-1-16]|uniref:CgeB family protein n=1 Tax=Mesorhizobium sp. BR1-1-16 TaxID=2876653 RepID=UPI001CCCC135|nr:glycosyltransferase [Mesorhizobium sp. BR1-1-16]MBZ9936964.1 glycosyltransferase [Mesorhizobium sp. BR1-1-16]
MRFAFYTHSLVSDWNHGNAHFQRGIMQELIARGHRAVALQPAGGWSEANLVKDQGEGALQKFGSDFPDLDAVTYDETFDHEAMLSYADVVVVHEWTDPGLVARIGRARRAGGRFALLFHDTHHRAVSDRDAIAAMPLEDYDGVLAFGEALRERYLAAGWGRDVHTWHEAADTRHFHPLPDTPIEGDLVWIGNWGDGERSAELASYLIEPVRQLGISATVHGVRYPDAALQLLAGAGIAYRGWLANARVPEVFAAHKVTVHVPRRPYVESLPGIPTIRVFEALACGIPLVSAPWSDAEGLFRPNTDLLFAQTGAEMAKHLRSLLADPDLARAVATNGLETIMARHTCAHRVDQLFAILGHSEPVATPLEAAQ